MHLFLHLTGISKRDFELQLRSGPEARAEKTDQNGHLSARLYIVQTIRWHAGRVYQ